MNTEDPRKHKAIGRSVKNFDMDIWNRSDYDIVVKGNLAKFRQNPRFLEKLLATGNKVRLRAVDWVRAFSQGRQSNSCSRVASKLVLRLQGHA